MPFKSATLQTVINRAALFALSFKPARVLVLFDTLSGLYLAVPSSHPIFTPPYKLPPNLLIAIDLDPTALVSLADQVTLNAHLSYLHDPHHARYPHALDPIDEVEKELYAICQEDL